MLWAEILKGEASFPYNEGKQKLTICVTNTDTNQFSRKNGRFRSSHTKLCPKKIRKASFIYIDYSQEDV